MPREPYPLEAARTLRERELDAAKEELARHTDALAQAELGARAAEDAVAAHVEATRETAERERARDAAGRSAADMLAVQSYLTRRRDELAALRARAGDARQAVLEAAAALDDARAALAQARAAREAVEKHREKWDAGRRRTAERRAEADLDDLSLTTKR